MWVKKSNKRKIQFHWVDSSTRVWPVSSFFAQKSTLQARIGCTGLCGRWFAVGGGDLKRTSTSASMTFDKGTKRSLFRSQSGIAGNTFLRLWPEASRVNLANKISLINTSTGQRTVRVTKMANRPLHHRASASPIKQVHLSSDCKEWKAREQTLQPVFSLRESISARLIEKQWRSEKFPINIFYFRSENVRKSGNINKCERRLLFLAPNILTRNIYKH